MAQKDLATAGYLLFAEVAGGTAVMFALGQLGFDATDIVFLVVLGINLVTAVLLARAARAQGRNSLLYGLCSILPPGALCVFWRLRERELWGA
jgi:hypothetical protein